MNYATSYVHRIDPINSVGYYGVVNHKTKGIHINADVVAPRRAAAMFHEAMHALERKFNITIPHHEIVIWSTQLVSMLPERAKLYAHNDWKLDLETIPMRVSRGGKDSANNIVYKMLQTYGRFNKLQLKNPTILSKVVNMFRTFSPKANAFNEEEGTFQEE